MLYFFVCYIKFRNPKWKISTNIRNTYYIMYGVCYVKSTGCLNVCVKCVKQLSSLKSDIFSFYVKQHLKYKRIVQSKRISFAYLILYNTQCYHSQI